MLHPLPFRTFGETAALGLEVAVYCPRCYETRLIDPASERLRDRCFATARFHCTKVRYTGELCGCPGSIEIRPSEPLPVGGADDLAFLSCKTCLWQINHVPIDMPPWSVARQSSGDRFRCPGCRQPVDWHIYGPRWRPTYGNAATSPSPPGLD